jgi:hypothetical protein
LLAIRAMNAIGERGRWSLDVPASIAGDADWHLYASIPQLCILPTARPLVPAMRIMNGLGLGASGRGLIVSVANAGEPRVDLGIVLHGGHERRWYVPLTLWLRGIELWVVPDPWHPVVRGECFNVTRRRLMPARAPWADQAERRAGLMCAATWMTRLLA